MFASGDTAVSPVVRELSPDRGAAQLEVCVALALGQPADAAFEMMGLADFWTNGITDKQFGFGVGIGFQGIYRSICPRVEVVFERWMKSGFASRVVIKALFGFSFYGLD